MCDKWKAPPPLARRTGPGNIATSDAPRVSEGSPDYNRAAALSALWRWSITVARAGIRRGVTLDDLRGCLWAHIWAMGWAMDLSPLDRRMLTGDVIAQLRAEGWR
ncbi:MAG: hypothetical protein O9248_00065 [Rhodobacteraceae bacterium]|nr:hypothetical protein [Paracoccaceae bacterium]